MSVGFAGLGHGVLAVPVPSSGLGNDPVVVSGYRSRTGTVAAERTQRLSPQCPGAAGSFGGPPLKPFCPVLPEDRCPPHPSCRGVPGLKRDRALLSSPIRSRPQSVTVLNGPLIDSDF